MLTPHDASIRLRVRLLTVLFVFCLLPVFFFSLYSYLQIKQQLIASTLAHLEAIAKIKSLQIDRFYKRTGDDMRTIARWIDLQEYLQDLRSRHVRSPAKEAMIARQIQNYIAEKEILQLCIVQPGKTVIACGSKGRADAIPYFSLALGHTGSEPFFSEIYKTVKPVKGLFRFTTSLPIYGRHRRIVGFVVAQSSADSFFCQIQDPSGLGESGETLLGKRIDNRVIFLSILCATTLRRH